MQRLFVFAIAVCDAAAFSVARPALTPSRQLGTIARSHLRMGTTGTETIDFTLGSVRPQRDVTDEQMRPRPTIKWENLRARLELEFKLSEEELNKYDAISGEDLLKACVLSACA